MGGAAAARPRIAETYAEELSSDQALALVERIIEGYGRLGKKKRIGDWIEEHGLDAFRKAVDGGFDLPVG